MTDATTTVRHPDVLFSIYERIWKRAEDEGVLVMYRYLDDSMNGQFDPREDRGKPPII